MSGSADFRIAPDYNWPGIPAATLSLGDNVNAYWAGNLNTGAGTFVSIGELAGVSTASLKGGNIGGRQITYRIGGRGGDAVFAGTISEQANGITNLVKQGAGVWTLSGNAAINGDVTVEAGTLNLGGTLGQIAGKSTTVADAAMMTLDGTLNSATLRISSGGSLDGQGTLNGDLANDGLVELASGSFAVAGNITNSGYFRVRATGSLALGGTFTNSGVLNLIGSSQPVPPGTSNTGVILTDRAPGIVRWSGSNGPLWDIHTSVNWLDVSSQPAVFFPGDAVVFDDSATITDIELAGSLAPASVNVATAQSFTFTGGAIGGSGGLVKSGSGSLAVTSTLEFTGNLTVAAGSLTLASASSWPAASPVIEVDAGATLGVVALPSGATIGAARTLRGAGTVDGDLTIIGGHDPGPGSTVTGAITYQASSRVSWSLSANSTATGSFGTISAEDVVIESGASLNLVFNSPGSAVDFTQSYWASPRSWTVLSSATRAGVFSIGSQSTDAQGGVPGGFGVFSLSASGGSLVLNWSPILVIAIWKGVNNGNWDLSTPNWDKNGAISVYQNGVTTRINDGSSVTAINIVETVSPGPMEFDSSLNHTIGGAAPINGSASLDKKGGGTLTLTSANGFSGGTAIHSGSLAITHAAALGTGVVTLSGGHWNTGTLAPANSIVVTADSVIGGGSGNGSHGIKALSGAGVLTIDAASVFDLEGPMSSFSGTVRITGPGSVRFNGSFGSAAAAFELGTRPLSARNGGTYQLGSLAGQPGSLLNIASYTGGVTFNIGGNNASTVFAGNITNGPGTTTIIKTGSGTLTLAGTCTHTGSTSVSAGTLRVTGSLADTAVTVNANATLETAGSILIPSLVLQSSATLGMTAGPASVPVRVSGNVTLAGSLRATVAAGTTFGRFPILTCGGTRTGTFSLTSVVPQISHHVSYTAGEVILFLDDSDEDTLPDTWELANFGNLAQAPGGDFDNDGTSNLVESRLGLDPASGGSAFSATCSGRTLTWPSAAGVVFSIRRNTGLDPAGWQFIGTITGGSEATATFTDPEPFIRAFYQISFEP
jgi:autotransporter-associated beta strand protein